MFFFLNPTVVPAEDFDPLSDAQRLRKAMKGLGTDEDTIIDILTNRSSKQRQAIIAAYKEEFDRKLKDDLKKELKGDLEKVLIALMYRPVEYLCKEIRNACKGLGTDEDALIEILCSRDNFGINKIVNFYEEKYEKTLHDEIKSELSGDLRDIILPIVSGQRNDSMAIDEDKAREQAEELFNAGEAKWGTDESVFSKLFGEENFRQLAAVFVEYKQIAGHSIKDAVKSETSGDFQKAMLTIIECISNTAKFFAKRLHKAMEGLGTADHILIRIIVSRSEFDLENIKTEYEKKYGKSLADAVASDTKGDYRKVLLGLIK